MAPSSSPPRHNHSSSPGASDERTPLLASVAPLPLAEPIDAIPEEDGNIHVQKPQNPEHDVPLPRAQIYLLCYTRVVEPIAFFSIFPYINHMIETVGGIEVDDVGFYSGMIESVFSLTQMCVMIFWGKTADRFGRQPVLALSLFGVTLSTALFGLSKSIWQMVLFRCLGGVFAGTIVTVRAMITENSTHKTQAQAFSYFAFAGNVGIFLGPLIGGALERPAEKFESVFGNIDFFQEYPYALPGFASGLIGLSAALVATFFIKETLHIHQSKKKAGSKPISDWELINSPGVPQVIIIYNFVLLLAFAYTAVNPVYLYTPVHLGGTGLSPELIAAAIAISGASQALWLLFAFPAMHRRIGSGGVLRLCAIVWPFFFLAYPLCNIFLRYNLKGLFWTVGTTDLVIGSGIAMSFTACSLAVNDIAPSHETLGTLNAIFLAIASGLRAFAPALATSIYATGVKYHIIGGHLFWVLIIALSLVLYPLLKVFPQRISGPPRSHVNGGA